MLKLNYNTRAFAVASNFRRRC